MFLINPMKYFVPLAPNAGQNLHLLGQKPLYSHLGNIYNTRSI